MRAARDAARLEARYHGLDARLDGGYDAIERRLHLSHNGRVQAERAKLAADIDEDLLDTYQRLFETKDAQAIVALTNDICQGCHVKAQTHIIHAVKAGKTVTTCLYCGRILYPEN